tara:strand:+ start:957 stop:1568 length:612 start_codon:yes stop_codon:yes gene_type:complete
MFITFEGIEGSGKTTQIQRVLDWLASDDIPVVSTLEPGGTPIGLSLRDMLLSSNGGLNAAASELFLFAADRCEHIHQVIQPALYRGDWVICDRYIDSTFAYQYGGRQHKKEDVLDVIRLTHAIEPDLTFLLDLSPEEGIRRAVLRGTLDRFETQAMAFHERVRAAYLECAETHPHRFFVIPSDGQSEDDIFHRIHHIIQSRRT